MVPIAVVGVRAVWGADVDLARYLHQTQRMRSGTNALILWPILVAWLTGCSPSAAVSDEDISRALTTAVDLAVKSHKISKDSCISSALDDSVAHFSGKAGEWTKAEGSRLSYRQLRARKFNRLPPEAIAAVPEGMRTSSCRHRLVFGEPEFLEANEAGRISTFAVVNFSDLCPHCGAGYTVMLSKSGGHWQADRPDVEITWIS